MSQQILNDGENKSIFRGNLNSNFSELYDNLPRTEALASAISALQAEATAKWVLLNVVDNRSRANEAAIVAMGGSSYIAGFYANQVNLGNIDINDVPDEWKESVQQKIGHGV